jgi:hypothetical protein
MANYGSTLTEGNERKMRKELCTRRRKGRKARRDKEKNCVREEERAEKQDEIKKRIILYTKNNII